LIRSSLPECFHQSLYLILFVLIDDIIQFVLLYAFLYDLSHILSLIPDFTLVFNLIIVIQFKDFTSRKLRRLTYHSHKEVNLLLVIKFDCL
jgi:ABC-type multidrug transport system fused ATPase/permease subunit